MATFQVPQFIEQKPRIVGFLTLPQFLYLAAGGALSFIAFHIFNFFLWFMITLLVGGLSLALAFLRVNGQELPAVMFAALKHVWRPHIYTWQRPIAQTTLELGEEQLAALRKSMSIQEKIKSLALSITTRKSLTQKRQEVEEEKYQVVSYLTGEKKVAKRVDY